MKFVLYALSGVAALAFILELSTVYQMCFGALRLAPGGAQRPSGLLIHLAYLIGFLAVSIDLYLRAGRRGSKS